MKIFLVRHGETNANKEHRYAGARTDVPLNSTGVAQAQARAAWVAESPQITRIYQPSMVIVSPLERAISTAKIIFDIQEPFVVSGLREMDFGDFDGRSAAEMTDDAAYRSWVDSGCTERCPHGESKTEFIERTVRAFRSTVNLAADMGVYSLACVAHGGTLRALMSTLADTSVDYFEWNIPFCGGYLVDWTKPFTSSFNSFEELPKV